MIEKGDEIRQRKQNSYGEKILRYNVAAYVKGKHPQVAILRCFRPFFKQHL